MALPITALPFDFNISDNELVEKLKRKNIEIFYSLVRMHLSFVIDLSTEEQNTLIDQFKSKKWNFQFSKKLKPQTKGIMDGAPLTQEGICQVYQLIEFLSKEENISQEGIFRRTGSLNRQQELRSLLNSGKTLNLDNNTYNVHDCASVLKIFLSELPEPLLTDAHFNVYSQLAEVYGNSKLTNTNRVRLLRSLQLLLLLIPPENRVLLKDLIELLNGITKFVSVNKMSADSLATLFTPHLVCPKKISPELLHTSSQSISPIVAFMIKKGLKIFEVPPRLSADIRAYFLREEIKKASPNRKNLKESISDGLAINTIYTFVDQRRTAEANCVDSTEAALTQLYAHIQSLPESKKKYKLLKQFHKEQQKQNASLNVAIDTGKKNCKSKRIGNSLKKRIFAKTKSGKKNNQAVEVFNQNCVNSKEVKMMDSLLDCLKRNEAMGLDVSSGSSGKFLQINDEIDSNKILKSINEKENEPNSNQSDDKICDDVDKMHQINEANNVCSKKNDSLNNSCKKMKMIAAKNLYLTSTPMVPNWSSRKNVLLTPSENGRRSMSPIMKSMPKNMQETMLTPRSRNPIFLLSRSNLNGTKKRSWDSLDIDGDNTFEKFSNETTANQADISNIMTSIEKTNSFEDYFEGNKNKREERNEDSSGSCQLDKCISNNNNNHETEIRENRSKSYSQPCLSNKKSHIKTFRCASSSHLLTIVDKFECSIGDSSFESQSDDFKSSISSSNVSSIKYDNFDDSCSIEKFNTNDF